MSYETVSYEEFEYEYDPVETETFYVDLDLSTTNAGRRERLNRRKSGLQTGNDGEEGSSSEPAPKAGTALANINTPVDDDDATIDVDAAQGGLDNTQQPSEMLPRANDIQILDLHDHNPLISYQNQIYHCTWSDMIGTAMFFSKAEVDTEEEALLSTNDFQLLNTSRIKLIGQKANLAGKPGRKRRRQAEDDSVDTSLQDNMDHEEATVVDGKSLGEIRSSNPKVNADIKRQAAFLERMMDVKRAKGEMDNVRTVFSQRRAGTNIIQPGGIDDEVSRQRQGSSSNTANEIEELNRRVVRGDATALMRLQDIYSSMEDDALNHSSEGNVPAVPSQTPKDGNHVVDRFE